MCQRSGRNLDPSSGSNAPGSVSTDSRSIFKWPVITIGEQIKMDFRWRFMVWKETWACCFWTPIIHHTSSATCLHWNKYINVIKRNPKSTHTAILQINKELTKKKKAHSSLIIDVLAELTRQARNPGYNLWDKYFIAYICLYILCQRVLQLLQMNVKRKVSEQAVGGMEQRCSSAGRRREEKKNWTANIFPWLCQTNYICSLASLRALLFLHKLKNIGEA